MSLKLYYSTIIKREYTCLPVCKIVLTRCKWEPLRISNAVVRLNNVISAYFINFNQARLTVYLNSGHNSDDTTLVTVI